MGQARPDNASLFSKEGSLAGGRARLVVCAVAMINVPTDTPFTI